MYLVYGKPVGVCLLVVVIGIEGFTLIGAAVELALTASAEWLSILVSAALGCLLLVKAFRLWSFHRAAWLMVLVGSAIGGITHSLEVARGHADASTWLAIVWSAVAVLYLSQPRVRGLFVHPNRANASSARGA